MVVVPLIAHANITGMANGLGTTAAINIESAIQILPKELFDRSNIYYINIYLFRGQVIGRYSLKLFTPESTARRWMLDMTRI